MNKFIFFLTFFYFINSYACEVIDYTSQAQSSSREQLFNNMNNPGLRVSWNGMKEHNKAFGLGTVNEVIDAHERKLCQQIAKGNPKAKVKFIKSDFKGYYITCSGSDNCLNEIKSTIQSNSSTTFPDKETKFTMSLADAGNYQEGYIKSRALAVPEYRQALNSNKAFHQFIDEEVQASIREATKATDLNAIQLNDSSFSQELAKNIDEFRSSGDMQKVNPKFRRLITALDVLLEVPFSNSNNVEDELRNAAKGLDGENVGTRSLGTAQSGDDLFVVIKQGQEIERVVGADARGLGVVNMETRYLEYLKNYQAGNQVENINDLVNISMNAIRSADQLMEDSFKRYEVILKEEIARLNGADLDKALANTQARYHAESINDSKLMQIRAGAISGCGQDPKCVMDRVTVIHNNLKTMEKAGIDGHFGFNCLASEYLLLKHGL
jgi:hypothetical protein